MMICKFCSSEEEHKIRLNRERSLALGQFIELGKVIYTGEYGVFELGKIIKVGNLDKILDGHRLIQVKNEDGNIVVVNMAEW